MLDSYQRINEIISKAGAVAVSYFGQELKTLNKSTSADFRTKADIESEKIILQGIEKHFPSYTVFSEEKGLIDKKSEYSFIVDPLDGTNNFVLGVPFFSVTIALLKRDKILYAATHDPILKKTYYAEKNKGAYVDGVKLQVNTESQIANSTVSITNGYKVAKDWVANLEKKLYKKRMKRVLFGWSPALEYCLLASGKIEAVINYKNELYDFIAGKLLVTEAGGEIVDFTGGKDKHVRNDVFIASNGKIGRELIDITRKIRK